MSERGGEGKKEMPERSGEKKQQSKEEGKKCTYRPQNMDG